MGTSASSSGPGGGVPFDPPWLDEIELPLSDLGDPGQQVPSQDGQPHSHVQDNAVAPARRFQTARTKLREFVGSGNVNAIRSAVGHYSRTGSGGAGRAAKRMRTSTRYAANLFGTLQAARERTVPSVNTWMDSLRERGATAGEIIDEIVRQIAPAGGSQEEASCQQSMAQALERLLQNHPDADLLNLDNDHIWILVEYFLGYEAFQRLVLDIGQVFEDPSVSPAERVERFNEVQDYLLAELSSQIAALRKENVNAGELQRVLETGLRNTFMVYEGSL